MKKTQQLYEGKAKKVYATDVEGIYIVDYKDDATAFNGEKKGTIAGKGVINNRVTNYLMKMLEEKYKRANEIKEEMWRLKNESKNTARIKKATVKMPFLIKKYGKGFL